MTRCYICRDHGRELDAVAVCNELKKPVCRNHAHYCVQEGHGTSPLPDARAMPIRITVSRRFNDFHASIDGHSGRWGAGASEYEAIGNLVASHYDIFGIAVRWSHGGRTANHPDSLHTDYTPKTEVAENKEGSAQ